MSESQKIINGDGVVVLENESRFSILFPGMNLQNCFSELIWNQTERVPLNWELKECSAHKICLACDNSLGFWKMCFEPAINASGIRGFSLKASAKLTRPCREFQFVPLAVRDVELSHLLLQGIAMGQTTSLKFPIPKKRTAGGSYIAMLRRKKTHLQLSVPLQEKVPVEFLAECDENRLALLKVVFHSIYWDQTEIDFDAIQIFADRDPFQMMVDWADENKGVPKDFSEPFEPGWNSWDYYRWTITEDEVLKNAEFIAKDPVLSKYVKRIIVDDGWQYCYGEWTANPLFPNGMAYLAKELKKMGFKPGLWIAPTIVEPHCRIAQTERDMLALSEGDQPCLSYECMGRHGFLLDPTVPKVQKHLYDLFDHYASIGYEYFKLDFMGQTFNARKFHDRSVSRSEIAELIVKPIEEAVRGRAKILGCNYRFNGGNRYVDAVRVGNDIHSKWDNIRSNVLSTAGRFFSNKRWWINDPDFALCRSFGTANDPDLTTLRCNWISVKAEDSYKPFSDMQLVDIHKPQAEILLSIVLMSAGAVNLSDNMLRLNDAGVDLARRVVSAESGETGVPLDLFESELPGNWLQKVGNQYRVLLINWTDEVQEKSFDFLEHNICAVRAINFWNDDSVAIDHHCLRVELQPRSCLLAVVSPQKNI